MHGGSRARGDVRVRSLIRSGLPAEEIAAQVARALAEDVGSGDVTARLIDAERQARASLLTRESMVLCGREWFDEVFRQIDARVKIRWFVEEGAAAAAETILCEITGPARALLTGERTAMNFLQTLSGTATTTRTFVEAVAGTPCRILDTRKTLPGLRLAQKYAVRCGGGQNLRLGLYDMVLIKENHIMSAGSIATAIERARRLAPDVSVEIEVETLLEFQQALAAQPDVIMLDEFPLDEMREAVALNRAAVRPAKIEASGGVDLTKLQQVAATGVDFISIGSLTKHLRAIDLSLRFALT